MSKGEIRQSGRLKEHSRMVKDRSVRSASEVANLPNRDLVRVHVKVPAATRQKLKVKCLKQGETIQDVLKRAIDEYLQEGN